jgi:hypothetical protein
MESIVEPAWTDPDCGDNICQSFEYAAWGHEGNLYGCLADCGYETKVTKVHVILDHTFITSGALCPPLRLALQQNRAPVVRPSFTSLAPLAVINPADTRERESSAFGGSIIKSDVRHSQAEGNLFTIPYGGPQGREPPRSWSALPSLFLLLEATRKVGLGRMVHCGGICPAANNSFSIFHWR